MSRLDDALRLAGRLIVLALASVLALVAAGILLKPVLPAGLPPGRDGVLMLGLLTAFAVLVGHVVVVLLFERARWTATGLDERAWHPRALLSGGALGMGAIALPAAILVATGDVHFEEAAPGSWGRAAFHALVWLAAPALFEELLARGYALGAIAREWGETAAVAITSVGFGLLHLGNPGATVWSVIAVTIAGVFLAGVRLTTGSLAAAWLAHLGINWVQGGLLHAPISGLSFVPTPDYRLVPTGPAWLTGGAWGLEAGAVTAATLLVVTFLVFRARPASSRRRDR